MKTSDTGIKMIKEFEGCRLTAYECAAKVLTIGYGHTAGVFRGMKITQEQADKFLVEDLGKFEQKVLKYNHKYKWNQNEFDALVSFALNTGSIDKLTADGIRTRAEISLKFPLYNKAGQKVMDGLTTRRKKELALFRTPENWASDISYSAHSSLEGWGKTVKGGQTAGVKGKGLEAVKINAGNNVITGQVHVQDTGWMPPVTGTGKITLGTTGKGKPIEAVRLSCGSRGLTYKVHRLGGDWEKPTWNGGQAGTTGKAQAIDMIQITF